MYAAHRALEGHRPGIVDVRPVEGRDLHDRASNDVPRLDQRQERAATIDAGHAAGRGNPHSGIAVVHAVRRGAAVFPVGRFVADLRGPWPDVEALADSLSTEIRVQRVAMDVERWQVRSRPIERHRVVRPGQYRLDTIGVPDERRYT